MSRKKFTVLIVALAMLLTLMVPAFATADGETITVFFTDSENPSWGDINVHYWGGSSESQWPGKPMTQLYQNGYGQFVYGASIPANSTGIIFNHNGDEKKTNNIETGIVDGAWWYFTGWSGYATVGSLTNTLHAAVSATCTTDGNTAYYQLDDNYYDSNLNATTQAATVIPALGHIQGTINYNEIKAPTCTETGTKQGSYMCSRCNQVVYLPEETVPALGHDFTVVEWDIPNNDYTQARCRLKCSRYGCDEATGYVAATVTTQSVTYCDSDGYYIQHLSATIGDKTYTRDDNDSQTQPLPQPIGHDWNTPTYEWTQENGVWKCTATRVCKRNENHVETETVTATSAVKTPATCTVMGTTIYTVTFQNAAFATQTKDVEDIAIDPTAHDLVATPAADATCIREGNTAYWQCNHCSHYFADAQGNSDLGNTLPSQYIISALGHDWNDPNPIYTWADDNSTCTASHTCQRQGCGETETETVNVEITGNAGDRSYTATFTKAGFTNQSKPVPQYHYDNLDVTNGIPAAPSGEFFAAWFADANYSGTPLNATTDDITNAYAKFIKVETMTVAVQIRQVSSETNKPDCSDVRFITTVPDSKYFATIGFRVTVGDALVSSGEIGSSSNYLYDSIISLGSPVTVAAFGPGEFDHRDSAKLVVQTVTGMPASYFADGNTYRIKVVPYIVTNDNRTIEGPAKFFKGTTDAGGRTFITSSTPIA